MDNTTARSAAVEAWCTLPVNLAAPTASFQVSTHTHTRFPPAADASWQARRPPHPASHHHHHPDAAANWQANTPPFPLLAATSSHGCRPPGPALPSHSPGLPPAPSCLHPPRFPARPHPPTHPLPFSLPPFLQLPSYQPTPGGVTAISLQNASFCPSQQPAWSAYRQPTFGHGVLDIQSATTARWSWYRNNQGVAVVGEWLCAATQRLG